MNIQENQIEQLKDSVKDQKVVLVCGVYDILHVGHSRFLKNAKELGEVLVVGLARDRDVKIRKGSSRPVNNESERAELISTLEPVDHVIIGGDEHLSRALIRKIKPDAYAYSGELDKKLLDDLALLSPETKFIKLDEFDKDRYSTTSLINKLKVDDSD